MTESPDIYFNDGEWYKARPDMTKARHKNTHAIKALEVLYNIGTQAAIDGDRLFLTAEDYGKIIANVNPKSISRPKIRDFLQALQKFGLEISGESKLTFKSTLYPKLLVAMKAMCQYGGGDDDQIRFFAFHRCDFKAVEKTYVPDISQVLLILPEEKRKLAEQLISHMTNAGYKMELQMGGYPNALWIVKFSGNKRLKASSFFWFGFSIDYLNMFYIQLHCVNPQHLIPIVYSKGREYMAWFDRNWHHNCDGCGYCKNKFKEPGPYLFKYNGKKRGLCHQNWLESRNPSEEQVQNLLKMVDLHTEAGMTKGMP